jgi:IMP dehydrogenase
MAETEIGLGKSGRRAYRLDEVTIVPTRRTRDAELVDTSWELDAYRFDLPILASAMDSVVSPDTAIALGDMGAGGVLHLEGVWTRHDAPDEVLAELASLDDPDATRRLREIYATPVRHELVVERIGQIKDAGVMACAAVTPQRTEELMPAIREAELDLLVIQGSVLSAEHVSSHDEPLNLKTYIRQLDIPVIVGGCASYQAALHLMRTGAAGVLVGVGSGSTGTTGVVVGIGMPQATAIADARAARMRHLDETGVYVHVIADGGMSTGGDIARAIVCGADAVMLGAPLAAATDAPGRGYHWGMSAAHATLPKGTRVAVEPRGSLAEVVSGPAVDLSGRTNLVGALRGAMASCGYDNLKEFQKADLMVTGLGA